ncbi:TIGR02285 family protein [Alteromonas oceanisediminis]|uniref:TIGR02285 family protein n=1 Tax=Alteromonas oceanisediminis TaxID=2836180 RepID=UPI001BD9B227|nr:TIGR02285 family protein [Alteromonas oceanisediminis]MBT0586227.1 TIGR02285 family protein [Alteromonas oceanisediminis]
MRIFTAVIITVALGYSSNVLSQGNTIRWQTFHVPPLYMKTGELKGQGFIDALLAMIIAELPEYEHLQPLTTQARAMYDIRLGKQACHPALFKTAERETYAVFSHPAFFTPANRLILTEAAQQEYQLKPPVSVDALLQHDISLALINGRSYGKLDSVLAKVPVRSVLLMTVERNDKLFELIIKRRVDASVAYPFELNLFNLLHSPSEQLVALPIAGIPEYAIGHVACPDTPWGQQVIERVNAALHRLVAQPEYQRAMTTWWSEERGKPSFISFYREEVLKPNGLAGMTAKGDDSTSQ